MFSTLEIRENTGCCSYLRILLLVGSDYRRFDRLLAFKLGDCVLFQAMYDRYIDPANC